MKRHLLTLSLLAPAVLVSCVTDRSTETVERPIEASTDEVEEELDPNDPNVMVCPVTGAMQRIDDEGSAHHGMDTDHNG